MPEVLMEETGSTIPLTPIQDGKSPHEYENFTMDTKPSNEAMDYDSEAESEFEESNSCMRIVDNVQSTLSEFYSNNKTFFQGLIGATALVVFHVYLGVVTARDFDKALALLVLTILAWLGILYFRVLKPLFGKRLYESCYLPVEKVLLKLWGFTPVKWVVYLCLLGAVITFLIVDTLGNPSRLIGIAGLFVFLLILFLFSANPSKVKWRPVLWGLATQFVMALLVLRWSVGKAAFAWLSEQIVSFLDYTKVGTAFVYGFLAAPPNICGMNPVFAFTVLQVIIYFGSIVSVLYFLGVMQFVLKRLAWLMQLTLGTTAAESLNAAACIFLGQSEAPLLIRPYLIKMTTSELHAVMSVGFSCIAGSLFAAYIAFGACPQYLLSAAVMNAPAALASSKLFCPETKKSKLKRLEDLKLPKGKENNILECISNGAVSSIELVAAIIANLIVFLALLAFVDNFIAWLASMLGYPNFGFGDLLGYLFFPLAFVMGSGDESLIVARLMGQKTVLNEFIAYSELGKLITEGAISERGQMIATYALCGFANLSSIGIQMGILGGMCPEKKPIFTRIAVRALIAGMCTNFITASIAGVLVETPMSCPPPHANTNCTKV